MAGLLARTGFRVLGKRPSLLVCSVRGEKYMADPLEHATGIERQELEAIKKGNPDPFMMRVMKRGLGTKDQPTTVPSFHESRIVGCICHEEAFYVNWMWLYKGEPKRCECGYWFKLTEAQDPFK
ncbi:unnamed protein product [Orchesella dallaii]|uniref:Cytochrome c oxidase subunit 5B, mitochondrial n=1 Tax=Orchesella dallaii TaxID=48710 RepID=A0ABP1PN18_9HEXA